jgi:hypothetical protein
MPRKKPKPSRTKKPVLTTKGLVNKSIDPNKKWKKTGRPTFKPTAELKAGVRALVVAGVKQTEIASYYHMSLTTLQDHFAFELDQAVNSFTGMAVGKLYDALKKGQPWAICFYLKCRAGWREIPREADVPDNRDTRIIVEGGLPRRRPALPAPAPTGITTVH